MKHMTLPRFWQHYHRLPTDIQKLADKNFELLKADPFHPSLRLKRVGKTGQLWSARVGIHYRVVGRAVKDGILWFWIGTHSEYDQILS
ncbi:MAG: hypothetical protein KJZ86_19135 [Caldilineaceae bacterium]|nr:hypothetical protein [Caldilineaceae bacterium]HRJ40253.1 hypothetical protein [Caldilineaceae bacterium]